MNPRQVYNALLNYETDGRNPPDGRRVIRDERMRLGVALEQAERDELIEKSAAAARVLSTWRRVS